MTKKELIRELEEKKWELEECQIIAKKQAEKIKQLESHITKIVNKYSKML